MQIIMCSVIICLQYIVCDAGGYRTNSSSGEWPVSYHETACHNANSIAEQGYLLSKSCGPDWEVHGKGIYCTPSIDIAEYYAEGFQFNGKRYKVVFQNHVSKDGLNVINTSHGEYWLQPYEKLIQPYGLCIKEV